MRDKQAFVRRNPVTGPLSGVRVLDLSRVLAAPWATQILADLGAEVMKVERPGNGDDSRALGPPFSRKPDGSRGESAFFLCANRGKRSMTIDLSRAEGQALVRRMAADCDVLVENFKVGDLRRYGLDYDSLSAVNPGLIYCSVTGFGQTGPYSHRPGYDAIFQGMSGLMSSTGQPDGEPGAGPVKVGPSIGDILGGHVAANAVCAALYRRERDGKGSHIDISLLDATLAATSHYAQYYLISGDDPPRRGTHGSGGMPSGTMSCADGKLAILTTANDTQFASLCGAMRRPDLADDPRFRRNASRIEHRAILMPILEAIFAEHPLAYWLEVLEAHNIPSGPVNSIEEALADDNVRQRGMLMEVDHPYDPHMRMIGNPIKFVGEEPGQPLPPPLVGQHSDEILADFGLTPAEVAALRAEGVI